MLPTHTARESDEWQQCTGNKAVTRGAREGAARRDRLHAAAKARENQSHGQTAPGKTLSQNSVKAIEKIDTQKELAKIAGVSIGVNAFAEKRFGEFSKPFTPRNRHQADTGPGALEDFVRILTSCTWLPHPHARGGTFCRILQKVHFGTPHPHARGILCQNSDMILHPDTGPGALTTPG
jgi:hypothetical protein